MASKLCCFLLVLCLAIYATLGGQEPSSANEENSLLEEEIASGVEEDQEQLESTDCGEELALEEEEIEPQEDSNAENMNCAATAKQPEKISKVEKKVEILKKKIIGSKCPCQQQEPEIVEVAEEIAPEEVQSPCQKALKAKKSPPTSKCSAKTTDKVVPSVSKKVKKSVKTGTPATESTGKTSSCTGKSCGGKTKREVKPLKEQKPTKTNNKNSQKQQQNKNQKQTKQSKNSRSKQSKSSQQ